VEKQVMVHIVFRIESGERQPGKLWWEVPALDRFPERLGPFDVVVTVEIATADCRRGELKPPKNDTNDDGANYKLDTSDGRLGFKPGDSAGGSRHQSLNRCLFVDSQLVDQFE
jgi:hypothetical protein